MKKEINSSKFKVSKPVIIVTFFLFLVLIVRLCYLCIFDYKVGSSTITAFIKNRNTTEEVIMPKRGTIYDTNGNILANDVISYTLIAYLSDTRVDSNGNKDYVENVEDTSTKLATVLGVTSDEIKTILVNGIQNKKYQVEFGTIGKGLSELAKEEIDKLELQGIDFTEDIKRYYPNGAFASYLIGYTVNEADKDGNNWITGEMGIEEYYNDTLKGKTGFVTYEKDKYGYKIANGREYVEPAEDGNDIYLTIDSNIQLFLHNAVREAQDSSEAEWVLMAAMDAKTGKILGYSSTPSFDPNLRNMTSYIDPLVTLTYEPGSTMKIFSYMCAIDSGKYDGNTTYSSGSKTYNSENGGKDVTISVWREEPGNINYKYQIEAATAGYGQGITTTPIQHLEALTSIANNGAMLKPFVVDKIKNPTTGKVLEQNSKTEVKNIANSATIEKMKQLMASVINGDNTNSTGYAYRMDGYSLIGKTGTAQIFDYTKGKYMSGSSDYIYSFSGMFPENDPEIILYAAIKRPKDGTNYIVPMVKEVEQNITKYLNIEEKDSEKKSYTVEPFYNKNVSDIKTYLENKNIKVLVIGDGTKVINQYPGINNIIYEDDLVVLKTNNYDNKMINLNGYSYKEANNILRLMGVSYMLEGNGYVYEQSIPEGETITDTVTIKLKNNI